MDMVETDWTPGGVEGCGYANIVICTESSESLSWGITTALTIHFDARRRAVAVYTMLFVISRFRSDSHIEMIVNMTTNRGGHGSCRKCGC